MSTTEPPFDARVAAFCSPDCPELFHAVAYRNDIWKPDPFDVETIHEEARAAFQRLVHRACAPSGTLPGRILLLKGEAGSGKTHLMRAFRNWSHSRGLAYCGYLQMTSDTNHYGRYVLNNLIDSLDQPYDELEGTTTGLMRLSTALAESSRHVPHARLQQLREDELDVDCLARLIDALADQIVADDRFNDIDLDLIRALLYLQRDDPRIKGRVLKYLRCEDLSPADRALLGGLTPRGYDDAPQWVVQRLGRLMAAVQATPLALFVDQLEDIYNFEEAPAKFRRAVAALCELVGRVPTAVVVISCLEDFYTVLRDDLTAPFRDRIEKDPNPVLLKGPREEAEAVEIVSQRLRHLYESMDVPYLADDPTFPVPREELRRRAGHRTRDILAWCQEFREACIAAGRIVTPPGEAAPAATVPPTPSTTPLEQAWNDFRTGFVADVPVDEDELAKVLADAIEWCSAELESGDWFEAEPQGRTIQVERHSADNSVELCLVGVCNKNPRGGGLGRQIGALVEKAGELTTVVVRSTDFPTNPRAEVVKQLGNLIARGGRRAVVEDSDWRTMLAMRAFSAMHRNNPTFNDWLRKERPLSLLKSIRAVLGLDQSRSAPRRPSPTPPEPAPPETNGTVRAEPAESSREGTHLSASTDPIAVGVADDRAATRVSLDLAELTRHAAFLGGSGSGKTTVALNIIEQLLLRGVPAILVDRKGDLCGYARPGAFTEPADAETLSERRRQLAGRVDVALFTPGNPNGRPLSIAIVPAGLADLPTFEREQMAKYAASALAGMMNYSPRGSDLSRLAILASAISLLSQLEPDRPVVLPELIRFIADADPSLVNAVGLLDTKLFEKLVQDLETLRLTRGEFLAAEGERLDAEALLGLGRHAVPGRTRLSVISTKFLGQLPDVQFWVSQFLLEVTRWSSRSPSGVLQAVLFFDEADLYLPAQRQPPTKEPMENLLKRGRSAGLGLFLATQSPGDFDYKCRDTIRNWFVGRIKEQTSLNKMKPMLSECRTDIAAKLPVQEPGQFHLLRDGAVTSLRADRGALSPEQIGEEEILGLARATRR
jgi:DNA helicase HerA-like ATPase